jgi:hypothetical protein
MKLLVAPEFWGVLTDEQANDHARFFPCGHCSNETAQVFHNIIGYHRHVSADVLVPLIPEELDG